MSSPSPEHPPFDDWAADGAMLALARVAAELTTVDADEAWRRLGRLTIEQRSWVLGQIDAWGAGPPLL